MSVPTIREELGSRRWIEDQHDEHGYAGQNEHEREGNDREDGFQCVHGGKYSAMNNCANDKAVTWFNTSRPGASKAIRDPQGDHVYVTVTNDVREPLPFHAGAEVGSEGVLQANSKKNVGAVFGPEEDACSSCSGDNYSFFYLDRVQAKPPEDIHALIDGQDAERGGVEAKFRREGVRYGPRRNGNAVKGNDGCSCRNVSELHNATFDGEVAIESITDIRLPCGVLFISSHAGMADTFTRQERICFGRIVLSSRHAERSADIEALLGKASRRNDCQNYGDKNPHCDPQRFVNPLTHRDGQPITRMVDRTNRANIATNNWSNL